MPVFDGVSPIYMAAMRAHALTRCNHSMAIPQYPLEVLKYATIHDHRILMDQAALKTISMNVDDVVKSLLPNGALAWVRSFRLHTNRHLTSFSRNVVSISRSLSKSITYIIQ
jgi:hypothetical protein